MYVSECIKKYMPQVEYKAINETEVDSLGLLVSKCNRRICSFVDDEKYLQDISDDVKVLLVTEKLAQKVNQKIGILVVSQPRKIFFQLHNVLNGEKDYIRSDFTTEIDDTAQISDMVSIPKKNVRIGKNVIIEPFVTIYENTVIEDNCIIRSGAIIGGSGFEHKRDGDTIFSVIHLGGTVLRHDVEIQNNSCIDRAIYPWDDTVIGAYTKIDNLVHVGHAAKVGSGCMIVAQVGIGGRTIIGNNVWLGFGATIRNGLIIENYARVNMGSVVTKNVPERGNVTGNFAIPHDEFIQKLKKMSD